MTPAAFLTSLAISSNTSQYFRLLPFAYPEPEYENNIFADRLALMQVSDK